MEKEVFLKAKNIFEKRFNCSLCRHNYERKANLELLPDYHLNPFCTGIKKSERPIHGKCVQFDQNLLQQQLLRRTPPDFPTSRIMTITTRRPST